MSEDKKCWAQNVPSTSAVMAMQPSFFFPTSACFHSLEYDYECEARVEILCNCCVEMNCMCFVLLGPPT